MNNLVRWRANPKKIRVSIMKFTDNSWRAKVTSLETNEFTFFIGYDPEVAILSALEKAEQEEYEGVDIGMQWAYEHPWKSK